MKKQIKNPAVSTKPITKVTKNVTFLFALENIFHKDFFFY